MKYTRFLIGLLMVLIIPVICFLVVVKNGGIGRVKLPPYYGGYTSIGKTIVRGKTVPDTNWYQVPNITMQNQLGKPVNIATDLQGKIILMDFINTDCDSATRKISTNFKFIQQKYKKADSLLHFVSITINPTLDTFAKLRIFANKLAANHDKWWLCRTDLASTKNYIYNSLKMPNPDKNNLIFTDTKTLNTWVVLDRERNIRGYYNAADTMEMRRCADDISLIILEKKHNQNLDN
jgi:protein SCO1